jgi:hypothetical protein
MICRGNSGQARIEVCELLGESLPNAIASRSPPLARANNVTSAAHGTAGHNVPRGLVRVDRALGLVFGGGLRGEVSVSLLCSCRVRLDAVWMEGGGGGLVLHDAIGDIAPGAI